MSKRGLCIKIERGRFFQHEKLDIKMRADPLKVVTLGEYTHTPITPWFQAHLEQLLDTPL